MGARGATPPAMRSDMSELPVELPEPVRPGNPTPSLLDARQPSAAARISSPSPEAGLPVSTPALYPPPAPDGQEGGQAIGAALRPPTGVPSTPSGFSLPPIDATPEPAKTPAKTPKKGRKAEPAETPPPEPTPIPTPAEVTVRQGGAEVTFSNVKTPLRTTPAAGALSPTPTTPDDVRQAIAESLKNAPAAAAPSPSTGSSSPRVTFGKPEPGASSVPGPSPVPPRPSPQGAMVAPRPATESAAFSNAAAIPSPTPPAEETDPEAIAKLAQGSGKDGTKLSPEQIAKLPPDVQNRLGALKRKSGAQVGERLLSQEDIDKRVKAALFIKGGGDLDEAERAKLEGFLTREWAQKTAIAAEARRQGVQATTVDTEKYRQKLVQRIGPNYEQAFRKAGLGDAEIQQEIADSTLVDKMVDVAFEKNVSEKKLREVYDASPDMFTPSRRLKVREIYKSGSEQDVEALRQRAAKGEDFAQLARAESEAPSRERGGDIGWIDAATPVGPEILQALAELKPGQVSPAVKSARGWRVLKLEQVEEPRPGFDGARPNVEAHLRKFLKDAAYRTALEHTKVIVDGEVQTADGSGKARVRPAPKAAQPAPPAPATGGPARRATASGASARIQPPSAAAQAGAPSGFGPALDSAGRR
jgi:parvulin-like peptidyl-prolyl isomerase